MTNLSNQEANRISETSGYEYSDAELNASHEYLLPTVSSIIRAENARVGRKMRIFDLGCGNGSVAAALSNMDCEVTGIDASDDAIRYANSAYPELNLHLGSAYDDLHTMYGRFDAVVSLEVVEHLFSPRKFASNLHSLLEDGGVAIVSTPYHGYWKNLALALAGAMDKHFTALWDFGHIKFWSPSTLTILLQEAGFKEIVFHRVGRISLVAKSMIAVARK